MYATSGLQDVIGISAESMRGRSFYYCISENCLQDAVKCLESAKGNDSIAYLRFWFRDPRLGDQPAESEDDSSDEEMTTDTSEDGGVHLQAGATMDVDSDESKGESRHSSGDSTRGPDTHEAIFGQALRAESSTSSLAISPDSERRPSIRPDAEQIELEAVISCTSDGLVVCLRKARPMIPHPAQRPSRPVYEQGIFAAPWATEPILPTPDTRAGAGFGSAFAPSLGPHGARRSSEVNARASGSEQSDFMNAIRDQAVFAWALTGINGSVAQYGHGKPRGEALPKDGLPIWESDPKHSDSSGNGGSGYGSGQDNPTPAHNLPDLRDNKLPGGDSRPGTHLFGDPGLNRNGHSSSRGM